MAMNHQGHRLSGTVVPVDELHDPLRITEFRCPVLVPGTHLPVLRLRHPIRPVRLPRFLERVNEVQDQVILEFVQPRWPVLLFKLVQDRNDPVVWLGSRRLASRTPMNRTSFSM